MRKRSKENNPWKERRSLEDWIIDHLPELPEPSWRNAIPVLVLEVVAFTVAVIALVISVK